MLRFIVCFIILIAIVIAFVIIKIGVPMWQFMSRADAIFKMYGYYQMLLRSDFPKGMSIELSFGKNKVQFANANEAIKSYEMLVSDALDCYDKLAGVANVRGKDIEKQKNELVKIYSEVITPPSEC